MRLLSPSLPIALLLVLACPPAWAQQTDAGAAQAQPAEPAAQPRQAPAPETETGNEGREDQQEKDQQPDNTSGNATDAAPEADPPEAEQPSAGQPASGSRASEPADEPPTESQRPVESLPEPPAQPQSDPADENPAQSISGLDDATEAESVPLDDIRRFVALFNTVRHAYVEPVSDEELMQAAIRGLLLDLDPHSAYLQEDATDVMQERTSGAYEGIGVVIMRQSDSSLYVIAPIDDTPAARAGLQPGDVIIAVDGDLLRAADEAVEPLRGEPGTSVTLTIEREGRDEPFDVTVQRDTIHVASVRGHMLEPGYGYLRISTFQADTGADFVRELDRLKDAAGGALRGLVLDLRSNPGGLLTTAVQVADELLERGEIVSTRGRIAVSDTRFSATPGDRLDGAPLVVLVDAGSASAAEVLAGALSDHGRARIVGSRTFGKGSVQTLLPLDNGDSVKLTTARYYTPSGDSIQALGIVPDVLLEPENRTASVADYNEASLPGHLRGEAEVARAGIHAGDVLDGQAPIDAALAELKQMNADNQEPVAGSRQPKEPVIPGSARNPLLLPGTSAQERQTDSPLRSE